MLKKCLFILVLASNNLWASESLQIEDPWIREAPPTATVMAAYMKITNTGDKDKALVSADCALYDSVEIHNTVMDGELARMVKIEQLAIPTGQSVELKPGGLHIMLIGVKQRPVAGDTVELLLNFSDQTQQSVSATVKKITGHQPMKHHHHHH